MRTTSAHASVQSCWCAGGQLRYRLIDSDAIKRGTVPGALPDFVRAQEERKASERGRDQRDALCQRPMNRPLVSKARPASIIKSREANIACVDPKITKDEIG